MKKDKKKTKKTGRLFEKKKRETFSLTEVGFLTLMTLMLGILLGVMLCYCKINILDASDKKLQEIISTYNNISNNSIYNVDKDKLAESAISGMIDSIEDNYSDFLSKDETKSFDQSIGGYYEGLGITITKDESKNTVIMEVAKGSPADKAGIKKDDILISVDDKDATTDDIFNISDYVSKAGKKTLNVTVKRNNKELEFKMKRARVEVESATFGTYGDLGYIDINNFALNTGKQFNEKLKEAKKYKVKGLIIDLRDNPGGHLGQVNSIVEPFFKKNTVIYQIKDNKVISKVRTTNKDSMNIPVVILVNESSASASEIVASCFAENYKNVTLVGKMTYGKGTIQKEVKLSTGSSIKYTTQKWLTSKGKWLDHENNIGIKPDVEVEYCKDEACKEDMQLEKAKEILNKE